MGVNNLKRKVMLFILVLILIPITYVKADTIDHSKVGSITVNSVYRDTKLSNMNIKIYKIASMNNSGDYVYETSFQGKEREITNMSSSSLGDYAKELLNHITSNNINYLSTNVTDNSGVAGFRNLGLGLYLIVSDELLLSGTRYKVSPLLIEVPSISEVDNNYEYNISIIDKVEIVTDDSSIDNNTNSNNDGSTIVNDNGTSATTTNSSDATNTIGSSQENKSKGILSLPLTVDNIVKYFIGLVLSIVGIVAIVIYLKSRKKEKNEEKN